MTQPFFLKDVNFIKDMANSFHIFSCFIGLKCGIAGIGVLKGVKVAVSGVQRVDLVSDTIKILGTHFSYNEKLKDERKFCLIIGNIQCVIKLSKLRNHTLEGKILLLLKHWIYQKLFTSVCYANKELRSY